MYQAPFDDARFWINKVLDFAALPKANPDEVSVELAEAVLQEAGKFGEQVLAPLNQSGDEAGITWSEQGVKSADGFAQAYKEFADGGWVSLTAPEAFGGQQLPHVLSTAVCEIWNAANMSFALCPLLSQGAIESLHHHGSEALQQAYLENLVSGRWTGTMNLTEPDAGTDLAAVKTKAEPAGDVYLITGQKIFITWGEHDMAENIVHLVLARLPDAPPGVKGISLFLVPKFLPNTDGSLGEANTLRCLSTEHKLGIHASPTCVMGYEKAKGFLIGAPNEGLKCMFTMMNNARLAVGLQGLAISDRAYQQAVAFAKERIQGTKSDGSRFAIIHHPDVRRMLLQMKATVEAMRGLSLVAAAELDQQHYGEQADQAKAMVNWYTPIVKAWTTELAQEVTSLAVQVHGGMGFIEETGVAQHMRDARILPIYEGTNGVQAMDLIGRKLQLDHGQTLKLWVSRMTGTVDALEDRPQFQTTLSQALKDLLTAGDQLLTAAKTDQSEPASVGYHFMMQAGYVAGAWMLARRELVLMREKDSGDMEAESADAMQISTQFYFGHILPRATAHYQAVIAGPSGALSMADDQW